MRGVPEVLFVCVHNAGRSQMAAALLDPLYGRRRDLRILDAGCGTGGNALFLRRYGHVVGIDLAPEALGPGEAPARLVEYQRQGKRSYLMASTYEGEEAPVLRRLSAEFELCAFGLSRVRREWERLEPPPGPPTRLIA